MSLILKLAAKAAIKNAKKFAIAKTVNHMEENHSEKGIIKKSKMKYKLILKGKSRKSNKKLYVSDEKENIKYVIEKESKNTIKLFDNNIEIGKVITNNDGNKVFKNYSLYLKNKRVGEIERKRAVKIKLDIKFNNWKVESDALHLDFYVTDDKGVNIIKIHNTYDSDSYIIEYYNTNNEFLGLLIVMVLELIDDE